MEVVSSSTIRGFVFATLFDSVESRSTLNSSTMSDLPSADFFFLAEDGADVSAEAVLR